MRVKEHIIAHRRQKHRFLVTESQKHRSYTSRKDSRESICDRKVASIPEYARESPNLTVETVARWVGSAGGSHLNAREYAIHRLIKTRLRTSFHPMTARFERGACVFSRSIAKRSGCEVVNMSHAVPQNGYFDRAMIQIPYP